MTGTPGPDAPPPVEVGVVSKAHGIKGEVLVVLHDPDSTTLGQATEVAIGAVDYTVRGARPIGGAYLLALAGVTDRDAAAALRGQPVLVPRDQLELDDGEVLLADLVGCQAVLADGTAWGEIVAVELGVQDRLVVHHDGVERLLPVVDAFVGEVDVERGVVVVTPPDGLPETPIEEPRR